jgi:hypothetical protein
VKDAFRRAIKDAHSDTGSGDGRVTVDDLVEAREATLVLEATTKFAIERHSEGPETATGITIAIGAFTVLAALVGLAAWSASSQEKMLELEIEGVAEAFEDKATIEDTLREVAESTEGFSLGHGCWPQLRACR